MSVIFSYSYTQNTGKYQSNINILFFITNGLRGFTWTCLRLGHACALLLVMGQLFGCGVSIGEKVFEADICCVEFLGRSIGTIR